MTDVGVGGQDRPLTGEQIRSLAAAAGVDLGDDRAAALVSQAEPHFALLRALDAARPEIEPAAEFRLDTRRDGTDG